MTWAHRDTVLGILHLRLVEFHLLLCEGRLSFSVFCTHHLEEIFGQYFGTSDLALVWPAVEFQAGWSVDKVGVKKTYVICICMGSSDSFPVSCSTNPEPIPLI